LRSSLAASVIAAIQPDARNTRWKIAAFLFEAYLTLLHRNSDLIWLLSMLFLKKLHGEDPISFYSMCHSCRAGIWALWTLNRPFPSWIEWINLRIHIQWIWINYPLNWQN
jgi:hypothetical protein